MQSLYDWIQLQRKTLSKHAEMAKAFDYILNHWNALNEFCRDGWVEIDNNIGENALRSVAVGSVSASDIGVVCGRGRNPTLRLWPAIFSGEIDVFPSERRNMGQEIGR